ncbi:protein FAM217B-like isoform X2 [Betta splendens]|uniref:Protein FAM217B-like isoform X2 n=1 Tax=Betta splendens TaxID=158456 RepID=A0A6P7MJD1_BETSP|nr:protein FAM217B-like isoform X2 [Betta splendens]
MGTILQEQVPRQRLGKVSAREREWSNSSRPDGASNKMGKRQSQRKPPPPQHALLSQENHHEKRLQHRWKHKPNASSAKRATSRHSAQGSLESKLKDRMEPKVQVAAESCGRREQRHPGSRVSRRTSAFSCRDLPNPSPHQPEKHSPKLEADSQRASDSDTDLSESERLPESPSVGVPPQLELRPEVIDAEDCLAQRHIARGRSCDGFPDFLPPPFNSWNLRQLAAFCNTEGRRAPRPRPVGSLERYLERLLQLEGLQIQAVQEESGRSSVSDVTSSCQRSAAAASSRLSSPKCILQCQRAFPLTFLSSLLGHSALLSSCACTLCCIRYFACSTSCCHTAHSHTHPSRISPTLERRQPVSLPKRSYSESRVHLSEPSSAAHRPSSPARTVTHLRRMQASGNNRSLAQGASAKPQSAARDRNTAAVWESTADCGTAGGRRRSGSEQRRGAERQHNGSERTRSGSECRRRGVEQRKTASTQIKPDAVTAIMDNLPASKYCAVNRPNRWKKQVEFVT